MFTCNHKETETRLASLKNTNSVVASKIQNVPRRWRYITTNIQILQVQWKKFIKKNGFWKICLLNQRLWRYIFFVSWKGPKYVKQIQQVNFFKWIWGFQFENISKFVLTICYSGLQLWKMLIKFSLKFQFGVPNENPVFINLFWNNITCLVK